MDTKKVISRGKRTIKKNIKIAQVKGDDLQKIAMKEYETVKKQMDVTAKKVGDYIKKNPKKAAMISAGIGAALGAALGAVAGIIASAGGKKKK